MTIATLLVDSNILARDGHGIYGVSDPFVAEAYRGRINVLKTLDGPDATLKPPCDRTNLAGGRLRLPARSPP